MKIGYRTIKTAIGTPIAISIAELFGVAHPVSAGILTILCIQPSRKLSILSAWDRFFACVLAIVFSYVFFTVFGYNPISVALLLTIFIPLTVYFNITQGIVTSTVIILNIYAEKSISYLFLMDQVILILVGIGVGLLLNLYMPSLDKKLRVQQIKLEDNFKVILHEISLYIRDNNKVWDQKEIGNCERILAQAIRLVEFDKENHMFRTEHPYFDYFQMRSRQFELFQTMLPLVSKLPDQTDISERIADFFDKLSEKVHPGNTAQLFIEELEQIRDTFDHEALPETQEEFETRANLFRLLHEIEDYLILKSKFKKSDLKQRKKKRKTGTS